MAYKQLLVLLASLLFLASGSGCYGLNVMKVEGDSFVGIAETIKENKVVSILIVHGMGGFSGSDPATIIDETTKQLKLIPSGEKHDPVIFKDQSEMHKLGTLKRVDFTRADSSGQIRFYTLHWSPATSPAKEKYIGDDNCRAKNPHRLSLNHSIKRKMVNGNLSDVVLYLGDYGKTMRIPLKKSVLRIVEDAKDDRDFGLVLISFSLGSIMLLDAIDELLDDDECKEEASSFCRSADTFFMLANQVPLLMLGSYQIPGDSPEMTGVPSTDSLKRFIRERQGAAALESVPDDFRIVAMSDPNDLLSYRIPEWVARENGYPKDLFVNVIISVSRMALIIPFVGQFADPVKAHRGYGRDQRVLDLMIKGKKKSE